MAKQEIVEYDNGATLIHQRQSSFNGYSFVIGFRGGAQLDGKHLGLSHLVEHMLFRGYSQDESKGVLDYMLKYSFNTGAFTTENDIYVLFSAVDKNVEYALDNFIKTLTNTKFTQEQIDREIKVIEQEKKYHSTPQKNPVQTSAMDTLLNYITEATVPSKGIQELLGTPRTLRKITPELLTKYVERYFNLDNLVISVTSNKPIETVEKLVNEKIFSKIPQATERKYIIDYPQPKKYKNINVLAIQPNPNKSNVEVNLMFRERSNYSENINREYAYAVLEEYLMNPIGGLLYNCLRVEKSLVYTYGLYNMDLGNLKYKTFSYITDKTNLNASIKQLCGFIKGLGENGFPRDPFENVKNSIVDQNNASLLKFRTCSALNNYHTLQNDMDFIDYKEVMNIIKSITYEEFNEYITSIYKLANVSATIEGDFDYRKTYNIVEIEELLGNTSHVDQKAALNLSRVEVTLPRKPEPPYIIIEPQVPQETYEPSVDIDDNEM